MRPLLRAARARPCPIFAARSQAEVYGFVRKMVSGFSPLSGLARKIWDRAAALRRGAEGRDPTPGRGGGVIPSIYYLRCGNA